MSIPFVSKLTFPQAWDSQNLYYLFFKTTKNGYDYSYKTELIFS